MNTYKDRKFKLFGETWSIKYVSGIKPDEEGDYVFGRTESAVHTIYINTLSRDNKHNNTEETLTLTLLHELVHAIFGSGQYNNSTMDEPLVEWTARCIHSLRKQNII